jgi:hypothetical protein
MTIHRFSTAHWLAVTVGLLAACSVSRAREPYHYVYRAGYSAQIGRNGHAVAPPHAPAKVKRAIAAGNELQGKPYVFGGGHKRMYDRGYDCSGTVSYVLNKIGLLRGSMPSKGFLKYGRRGEGDWVTVYAKNGHVFLVVAGLRLDTGGGRGRTGPRWKPLPRTTRGFHLRHPPGL